MIQSVTLPEKPCVISVTLAPCAGRPDMDAVASAASRNFDRHSPNLRRLLSVYLEFDSAMASRASMSSASGSTCVFLKTTSVFEDKLQVDRRTTRPKGDTWPERQDLNLRRPGPKQTLS